MKEKIITVEKLTLCYPGRLLLKDVDFEVCQGEWLGIYGEPESGKTSLLWAIGGVRAFYDGEITICGYPVDDRKERYKKFIGMVTQQPSLFAKMTVGENIDFIGVLHGNRPGSAEHSCIRDGLLEKLGLCDQVKVRLENLSRGQQKRVALACALVFKPRLLLLDDMTQHIDQESSDFLLKAVSEYLENGGTCISTISEIKDMQSFSRLGIIKAQGLAFCDPKDYLANRDCGKPMEAGR